MPPGWADGLVRAYDDRAAELRARFASLPRELGAALGLNATLRALDEAAVENSLALRWLLATPLPVRALDDAPAARGGEPRAAGDDGRACGAGPRPRARQAASTQCGLDLTAAYTAGADVLAHVARDWASGSAAARASRALARLLARHLPPLAGGRRARVLVPGAGTGGLALELAAAGYAVELNDASLPMLAAARTRLHAAAATPCGPPLRVRARALEDANVRARQAQLAPVLVRACAGAHAAAARAARGRLHLQLGSLLDSALYNTGVTAGDVTAGDLTAGALGRGGARGGRAGWDGVATHFVFDALRLPPHAALGAVRALLRPGGVWLFSGPLAYHDEAAGAPLALDELLRLLPHFNLTLRARRVLEVEAYAPPARARGGAARARAALVAAGCAVARAARATLLPTACAPAGGSMARNGYDAEVFVAIRR